MFASQSSLFNLVGMLSMFVLIYLYFVVTQKMKKYSIVSASVISIIGYLIVIFFLRQIQFDVFTALLIPIISIPLFTMLFKKVEDYKIENKIKELKHLQELFIEGRSGEKLVDFNMK